MTIASQGTGGQVELGAEVYDLRGEFPRDDLRTWNEISSGGFAIIPPQEVSLLITGLAGGGCRPLETASDAAVREAVSNAPDPWSAD